MRFGSSLISSSALCYFVVLLAGDAHAQSAGPLDFVPRAELDVPGTALFGQQLSLSDADLLVGAQGSGSIPAQEFVFHRSAGTWSQQTTFNVLHPFVDPCFPLTNVVAISGDIAVIGYPHWGSLCKAYVSLRTGTSWSTPVVIEDEAGGSFNFGQAALVRGNVVFIGSPNDPFTGEVWVWRLTPSGWVWQELLRPHGGHHAYGTLLASSGDTLLVGEDDAVEVLTQGASVLDWNFQAILDPVGDARPRAIAIDGDVAAVSILGSGPPSNCSTTTTSEVLVYERSGSSWSQTASLVAADTAPPVLGTSLAVHGDTIYVGAATQPVGIAAGAVYVFQHLGSGWAQTAKLVSNPPLPSQSYFGASLVTDGTTLCVGAPGTGSSPGTVQIFDITSLAPTQTYCTAKINSQGCTPQIGAIGVPGATNPNPFAITSTNMINHKSGFVLYSVAGMAATPFQGGTLCLASPLHRTPAQNSGGNVGPTDCSGTYSLDFNARVQSGIDPALVPGVEVWAQYYSRDPGDPYMVGLTDAVTFIIGS